jgi:hypothetical protein
VPNKYQKRSGKVNSFGSEFRILASLAGGQATSTEIVYH